MGTMASQIITLTIVYSTVYSGADQWKHQSSASLAFVRIHRWPVNSPHKWPVTRKMFPFDDVIMRHVCFQVSLASIIVDHLHPWHLQGLRIVPRKTSITHSWFSNLTMILISTKNDHTAKVPPRWHIIGEGDSEFAYNESKIQILSKAQTLRKTHKLQ